MKIRFTSALFLSIIAGSLALQSCQKTDALKDPYLSTVGVSAKSSSGGGVGGGGASGGGGTGGGHNGGGGGTTAPTGPVLAPTDTTTSQLSVADIITVGRWEVTSFVQGNDNTGAQFASYIF